MPDESSSDEEDALAASVDNLLIDTDGEGFVVGCTTSLTPVHRPYSADNSPQTRMLSQPKILRTQTSGASRPHASAPTSSTTVPLSHTSMDANWQDWRNKYGRTMSSASVGQSGKVDPAATHPYWVSQLHAPEDLPSDDDDDDLHSPVKNGTAKSSSGLIQPPTLPRTPSNSGEETERLEWQSMLASVLAGDVLQGESSRIGEERGTDETFRAELGRSLWWELRAKLRLRSEMQEKQRVEERRQRVVDQVLEEVERFAIKASPGPAGLDRRLSSESTAQVIEDENADDTTTAEEKMEKRAEASALDQVNYILQKLNLVEGLYPTTSAFRAARLLYNSDAFQARVDALTSWSTVVYLLQSQLGILQKWTGSEDLDITKPNTTREKALVGKSRYHPLDTKAQAHAKTLNDQTADDTTFLERIMKEDSLQRTFAKRIFVDLATLVLNAKETVVSHLPLFDELKLPNFQFELVRLIGFPGRLVIEALKVRLDAARKLVDPNYMVINDMVDNFRTTISLAVLIKRQYLEIVEPDADGRWSIPHCLPLEYDSVLLDGLRMFFRLLHYKLKNSSKTIYFRETDVLEGEMEFMSEAAEATPGGDMVVAEHLWCVRF